LGRDAQEKKPVLLVLSPTREDFLGLGSFAGALSADGKRLLWTDSLALWTSFNFRTLHVIALEHPATYPGQGDITQGMDMNAKEKTGLLQHVVQAAAELLIGHTWGESLPPELSSGLAMVMVIELFKENNVRAGGGSGGRRTPAYSKFVPGGRSSGGRLPAISAEPRWREDKGKDFFLEVLRAAQKDGAKDAFKALGTSRDKRAFFALHSDAGTPGHFVQAPFLEVVNPQPVPAGYTNDFREFFRAYRCAFAYWLKNKAKSAQEKAAAEELLRRFLQALTPPWAAEEGENDEEEEESPFVRAVAEVYGMPFSGEDGAAQSLEWAFLDWLARGK
jgi:hypothetical protein